MRFSFTNSSKKGFSPFLENKISDGDFDICDDKSRHLSIREGCSSLWLGVSFLVGIFVCFLGATLLFSNSPGSLEDHAKYGTGNSSLVKSEWGYCGNTSEEARTNGCVLDLIAGAWVPRACYDAELESQFLNLQPWRWFADYRGKRELTLAHIRKTGGPKAIWVSPEYHRQHCAFTWKKLHRAIIRQTPIDTHIGALSHTMHCSDRLTKPDSKWKSGFYHISTSCRMPYDCKFSLTRHDQLE